MNKRICAALSALLCCVMFTLPTFAVAETQPLTPDGNLEAVDDILHEEMHCWRGEFRLPCLPDGHEVLRW